MKIVRFLIPMSVFLFCLSCDKTPPEEAILGKWEEIAHGPNERNITFYEPGSICYMEFFPNGIRQSYYYGRDIFVDMPYRIDKKYLYYNEDNEDNYWIYKYKLTGNRLKLTYVNGTITDSMLAPRIFIYQRKK